MKQAGGNVRPKKSPRKSKGGRGTIRVREWPGANGQVRSAWQADFGSVNGIRKLRSFPTKEEAENWLREENLLMKDQGVAASRLSDDQRLDAIRARDELKDIVGLPKLSLLETAAKQYKEAWTILRNCNATLKQAAEYYLKHRAPDGERRTINQAVEEYIDDARKNNLRPKSVKELDYVLTKLTMTHGDELVSEMTTKRADDWLNTRKTQSTRARAKIIAHGLFNFCLDRGYAADNPFTARKHRRKYHKEEKMPVCMAWRDVQKIMNAAVEHESSMVPALAIGFFAGLRTAELRGLDWKDIDLAQKRITVTPETAKKRRSRYVEIEGNLLAWLMPCRRQSGLVAPDGQKWRSRLDNLREKAVVTWTHNAMRHSYASHHLAKYGDAVKTAFALGHQHDTGMLFEHYRALTTPEEGAKYFEIKPEAKGKAIAGNFAKTA